MEQVTINVYTAQELKEQFPKAFARAYEDYYTSYDYGWWSEIHKVEQEFKERFGVELMPNYDYPNYSRAPNLLVKEDWYGNHDLYAEDICGQKLVSYLLNHHFHNIYEGKYYSTRGYYDENRKYHYRWRKSKVIFEPRCLQGVCFGYDVMDPIHNLIANRRDVPEHYSLRDLFTDCAKSLAQIVYDDIEYHNSEEAFLEYAENNDCRYTSDGRPYRD
jgi:hypothetical protein